MYVGREFLLPDWYKGFRQHGCERAVYRRLEKGPEIHEDIKYPISREDQVEKVRQLITPELTSGSYFMIVGEHGTGKTSLIKLALDNMKKPMGVIYVNVKKPSSFVNSMQQALNWNPKDIDPDKSS